MHFLTKYFVLLSYFFTAISIAQTTENNFSQSLQALHHQWGIVNYTLSGDEQEQAFEQLNKQSIVFAERFSYKAEVWAWRGIIQSSFAGVKGGFGALSLVKDAKKSLEKAITIDGDVLSGSAYTSLGTLYHKVPGWPISFGDDDDAKKYLEKALLLDPKGIDTNYFYGELLYDNQQYDKAKHHLLIAKNSPVKYSADEYRKPDIESLIRKVEQKLAKNER
jgi:tetratricopeptide (TPR) repeat protein